MPERRTMSREKYKKYWYPGVMDAIRNYEKLGNSPREIEIREAIRQTMEEMLEQDENKQIKDGKATVDIVRLTLIKSAKSLEGAADTIPGLSPRKARRLRSKFIYKVAEKIGY